MVFLLIRRELISASFIDNDIWNISHCYNSCRVLSGGESSTVFDF